MSPDLEGAYDVEALACHACAAREAKASDFKDTHGVKLHVHPSAEAQQYLDERKEG